LRFGESTVVCGVFTPHGLKTRPIEIDVTAAPGLEPRGSARAGASWRVVGEDFRRHSHVMITLDGVSLATTSATQGGTVSASIMLPPGLTAGVHHLALTGRNPQGPVTPITALSLTGSGRLVAPNGTRSFDSAPHHGDTTTTSTT
jgi:hypothetical protein